MNNIIEKTIIKYKNIKPYFYFGNFLIFISKLILFFITRSLIFAISSLYNLGIALAKKKVYSSKGNFSSVGIFLFIASMCFIIYSISTILLHKNVYYNLYTALFIATVTFYDIGYSIYGIIKNLNKDKQNKLLMLVNLSTSLISLELTQSALLSFTKIGVDNSLYNGIIGIIVGIISLIIGIIIYYKNI